MSLEIPEEIELSLERNRIERVFTNLVSNALEAMPQGGKISISASIAGDAALVEVADDGPGIAPEIRANLFQPFVTAGKKNGLGLGRASRGRHAGSWWRHVGGSRARARSQVPLTAYAGLPKRR